MSITNDEWQTVTTRWPKLALDRATFERFVTERQPLHLADLFLVCACTERVVGAVEQFAATFEPVLNQALRRVRADGSLHEDAKSQLLMRLLVGADGERPKLLDYRGQGPLAAWLAVSVVRLALKLVQREQRYEPVDEKIMQAPIMTGSHGARDRDVELGFVEEKYRSVVERCFSAAWRALEAQDRNLLRFHFMEGMTTEELAKLYDVHRATAVRWLAAARQGLMASTRERVRRELSLSGEECDSLMRLVRSQLSVSLATMRSEVVR